MELMVDIASKPPWIPEDDLLLKNAIEAGASLESLAKGAVQFSRKYTFREVRDRWHSLLYDPVVSAVASASMVKLELSGHSVLSKSNGNGIKESSAASSQGTAKRRVESIRKHYYTMRKRLCAHSFDPFDMTLRNEMKIGGSFGNGSEKEMIVYDESLAENCTDGATTENNLRFQKPGIGSGKNDNGGCLPQNYLNRDTNRLLVDYRSRSGLEEVGSSHSLPDVPLWKTIEDVSAPTMPIHVSLEHQDHNAEEGLILPDDLKRRHVSDTSKLNNPMAIREDTQLPITEDTQLSDSLLDFTNGDDLLFINIDEKEALDKLGDDNLDSLLLSAPCEIRGNDAPDVRESEKPDSKTNLDMPCCSSTSGLKVVANPLDRKHGDLHSISEPGNDATSSVAEQSSHCCDLGDEFMYCTLNTEDPEIPSNDDVSLPSVVPSSVTQAFHKGAGYPVSLSNSKRNNETVLRLKKEENLSHSSAPPHRLRSELVPNISSNHPPVLISMKTEHPGRNHKVSKQSKNIISNPSHSRLGHATVKRATDKQLKEEELTATASAEVYAFSKAEKKNDLPEPEAKSLILDQEEDDNIDSDDDIPYYSDVEKMILEMDLCPIDQDAHANSEVSRYQHDETKRTIMRLEQCAQSSMQRAIASHGALARLYGRNQKHYIKKSEVILGRATDDVQVDINLGREGCANTISRRQALIKMDANGSFILKNIGKSSIFMNGKELASGQLRSLSCGSLIEIRGMAFVFEVNNRSVRRFLVNTDNKSEDKNNALTWVPEGGH